MTTKTPKPRGGKRPGAGARKGNQNARHAQQVVVTYACYTGRHDRCPRPSSGTVCQCRCHKRAVGTKAS